MLGLVFYIDGLDGGRMEHTISLCVCVRFCSLSFLWLSCRVLGSRGMNYGGLVVKFCFCAG